MKSRLQKLDRRDGVEVRASASQSVDLGFYSFPAWRSAFMGGCGEQAGKFACCVLGQGNVENSDPEMATPKRVQIHRPKHSDTSLSREWRINITNKKKIKRLHYRNQAYTGWAKSHFGFLICCQFAKYSYY